MLRNDDITSAYAHFLNRPPENEGVIDRHIQNSKNRDELRQRFLASPEFYKTNCRFIFRYLEAWEKRRGHQDVDYDCGPEETKLLFDHVNEVWSHLGEEEPHFSVLSTLNFKPENIEANMASFAKSGKNEILDLATELSGLGL